MKAFLKIEMVDEIDGKPDIDKVRLWIAFKILSFTVLAIEKGVPGTRQ